MFLIISNLKLHAFFLGYILIILLAGNSEAADISKKTAECINCHKSTMGIIEQWRQSAHWPKVGCYECHQAQKGEKDALEHNGYYVSTIVSPKDCGRCHPKETAEQEASHHAEAGNILNSKDGLLGQTVGGEPAVAVGCRQCHGSIVKTNPDGSLDPSTWPNTGIGRINPDGSKGSCSACHTRHRFSQEQARMPGACGKCHLGPDHPQKEVYAESKHGILYEAFKDKLNMDRRHWIVGEDYFDAPTCATCHMSATPNQDVTHDVGTRLSWNLRAPVSKKLKNWSQKRDKMQDVCKACHTTSFIEGFYSQLDNLVDLYNTKFAEPAQKIRTLLINEKVLTPNDFDDSIDWIYWELWHHEGRRARTGAAMSGPDYAWWHGIYDVAKHFYTKFLPDAKKACDKAGKPEVYEKIIKDFIDSDPRHNWFTKGFDPKRLEDIREYYKKRYGKNHQE